MSQSIECKVEAILWSLLILGGSSVCLNELARASQIGNCKGKESGCWTDEVGNLLSLQLAHLNLATLRIHTNIEVLLNDDERNSLP